MEIRELLTEGKTKRVYATDDPALAVVYFKDEAVAYHGLKRGKILGKGEVNNQVSSHIFTLLRENGIENHFIRMLDSRQSLVQRCEMIPVEIKVRNRVAGTLVDRIGLTPGTFLNPNVVELILKNEYLENPLVNESHICALHLATKEEMDQAIETAQKVNRILTEYMKDIGVELIDFKLEFGRLNGKLILADEITPDNARFWDAKTHEPMDIDRFRRDLDHPERAYQELLQRMMGSEA